MLEAGGPYILIGSAITLVGVWLIRTPRNSRAGRFLGPMIYFRMLGVILVMLGVFTVLAGAGMKTVGPYPLILD